MNTQKKPANIYWSFIILGIFGIAMGALEAIVVVYLRQIYYPRLFEFPLILFSRQMLTLEWLREASTIIMLGSVGILAGKDNLQKFSYFLYTFAIWDIFYYAWLKILVNWPSSFLTWDVLFLIPVPWIGPVLAPVIASLSMILLSGTILFLQEKGYTVKMKALEWSLIFTGALIILYTFVRDYSRIIFQEWFILNSRPQCDREYLLELISSYKPEYYNWFLFVFGEIVILFAILLIYRGRTKMHAGAEN